MLLESPTEEVLLRDAAIGDGAAFEALIRPHLALFYNGIYRILGNDSDSQDALQDALVAIFRDLPSFQARSRFSTWAYRICINAALMLRRSRVSRREDSLTDHTEQYDHTGHSLEPLARLNWSVAAEGLAKIEYQELRSHLMNALNELPDTQRIVFTLRDLEEWSSERIADHLAIDPAAVRQRLHRARMFIHAKLRAYVAGRTP